MVDLLIENGLIIDGSGNPGYYGSVAVEGDTLSVIRGDTSHVETARTIDASGHVVCPGFIDVHSHAGLTILGEPLHEPKVRQGITTELMGIDGNSMAPFKNHEDQERFIVLDRGLNGQPPGPAGWLSTAEYLSTMDGTVAVNVAMILGNSQVRIWSVGWNDRPATAAELEDMKSVVREAMEEGACGLSTGLDYPPGAYADTNELIELSKVAASLGGFYHTHTRASLAKNGILAPWEEAIEIGRKGGIPVHLTHYRQRARGAGSQYDFIGLVENGRDEGLDVTFDCYPYIYSSTRVIIGIPNWAKDGGPERLMEALQSADDRQSLKREMAGSTNALGDLGQTWLTYFRQPHNKQYEGLSLAEIARLRGEEELDCLFDLLVDEELGICGVSVGTNAQTLPLFVSHPCGMVGSDAVLLGDFPSPRSYGCFPVILAEFVRAEKHLRLPEAIRKMTSFAAQRLGIRDRGLLRDGMKADITIFDPKAVKAPATRTNPKQFPLGIPYVIVNGTVVIDGGEHTGATPGKGLRIRH